MLRRHFLRNLSFVSAGLMLPAQELFARFFGFKKPLVKGRVLAAGKPLAGVGISDGFEIIQTDSEGRYSLQPHSNARFIFIILPSGYEVPHGNKLASFFESIAAYGDEQIINFSLQPLKVSDEKHAFIIWGDTQILDKDDAKQLLEVSAPETKRIAASLGNLPVHGIALGDLVFDKFDLYPDYKEAVAKTGVPFFQVIGNHDMDLNARSDEMSDITYQSHFGPTYYSFNRGKVHYVVLDNVFCHKPSRGYIGYLTEHQLAWLDKDLALVPPGSTVVVSLHIPTKTGAAKRAGQREESAANTTSNRDILYKMLKPFNAHIMSAHTHVSENWVDGNLMEHNHGTVCGAWWSGPICSDGCPPGIGVYMVDGENLSWYYHPTGGNKETQIRLYAPGKSQDKPNSVVANVWNWDPAWKVEWMQDGKPMGEMERFTGKDPWAIELYLGPELPAKHKWVEPSLTEHLFAAMPASGAKEVTVLATDRFGVKFSEKISLA
ncbi:MAG: calcineurin-like phosphoesterase C-terminal domain-containing protein [Chitinophagaceae bacterium]|nr:calcineurin-like phosphoesterase C-terminal domain-containing protein [Chitinophagaceae bacterium]